MNVTSWQHYRRLGGLLGALPLLLSCQGLLRDAQPGPGQLPERPAVRTQLLAESLDNPVGLAHAGDGSGRLYVVSQHGRVLVMEDGRLLAEPFLDISTLISCCGEQGLLGIAFHPRYAQTGRVFVNYTDTRGDTVIAAYRVSSDGRRVDPDSAQVLMTIAQTAQIHNGGQLQFGPDGYLYIGTGDGGSLGFGVDADSGGDPGNRAQDLGQLLGKMLRIDVDRQSAGQAYAIPADNPFINTPGARAEIWARGLRNPWRFSFDRGNGDLYIADVGETSREEINLQPADSPGGENYGWRRMEGSLCFKPPNDCDDGSLVWPALEYTHMNGCAVIGGYVYRGHAIPDLEGRYLYADFCSGVLNSALRDADGKWRIHGLLKPGGSITSFGEDEAGELYFTVFSAEGGRLYQLIGPPAPGGP